MEIESQQRRRSGAGQQAPHQIDPLLVLSESPEALHAPPDERQGQQRHPGRIILEQADGGEQLAHQHHRVSRPESGGRLHLPVPLIPDQMQVPHLFQIFASIHTFSFSRGPAASHPFFIVDFSPL